MNKRATLIAATALISVLVSGPTLAQKADDPPADTRVVIGDNAATADLNQQQAQRAAAENTTNAQNAETYRQQSDDYARALAAAEADQRAYAAAVAANAAQAAADQAAFARRQAQWEADVRACNAGDRSRCAPPAPRRR
jgi:membrane protein involved in colicin uptake